MGKHLLAENSEDVLRAWLDRHQPERVKPRRAATFDAVLAEIALTGARGHATADGKLVSFAVPVRDQFGYTNLALLISEFVKTTSQTAFVQNDLARTPDVADCISRIYGDFQIRQA